jgi:hypothetical protein
VNGAVVVTVSGGQHPAGDPAAELVVVAEMTAHALDAGYTGLRMFADGTDRALDPVRRARQVRYEHLIDRTASSTP